MVFHISECKHGPPRSSTSQLVVPITLYEVRADAMDVVETFDVADCELIWGNADVRSVLLVERVDIFGATACHDCNRKRQSCEAGVPWSWCGFQRAVKCAIYNLRRVRYYLSAVCGLIACAR